ncbi:MAG: ABC transporter permease subunit, partial [Deltaproteobacteria bacterium]|nr:ABC transporter permease subunit [Deltaproteobacteria bacterium]
SMMLSGLVSAQVLTRELEDGTALLTLSRPLSRWGFLAGKVLSVMMLTTLNLFVLGAIFFVMFYVDVGHLNWRIFASFSLVTVSMLVYCLMGLVLSLVVPRMLVPLLAIVVYAMSVWAALPFHFEKLRFVWDPSETVTQLYTWLPGFGDLQFLGAACIGALPEPVEIALAVVKLLGYGLLMWVVLVMLFRRQAV